MADGVTKLGGGWANVPAGAYAENALALLLSGGQVEGEALVQALKDAGFADRYPAYYPAGSHGPGSLAMYALGMPHDYAAIDSGVWDLIGFDLSSARTSPGGRLPTPTPTPPPTPAPSDDTLAKLMTAAMQTTQALIDTYTALGALNDKLAAIQQNGIKVHM